MPNLTKQAPPPVMRASIYTRISWDPAGWRGAPARGLHCEALCVSRGWEITQYFEDKDASAYSGKHRRAYERMLYAIQDGAVEAVVTWYIPLLTGGPTIHGVPQGRRQVAFSP